MGFLICFEHANINWFTSACQPHIIPGKPIRPVIFTMVSTRHYDALGFG